MLATTVYERMYLYKNQLMSTQNSCNNVYILYSATFSRGLIFADFVG